VAVVGAGAFGGNHARIYHQLQQADAAVELAAIVDREPARAQAALDSLDPSNNAQPTPASTVRVFESVEQLIRSDAGVHAASVAVPTVQHLAVARGLMQAGIDVLIEKPLATSLPEADELIAIAARTGRIAQVGHLERFNPAVRATLPLIVKPMFFEVHRLSLFSPRALDVDVVLDLMIHDLDIVLSFVGSPVREVRAVGLPILSDKVDIANVRLEFENGCVANFTASRVSTERVRKLRFFQPRQYVSIDYSRQDVFTLTVESTPTLPTPPVSSPTSNSGFPAIALPAGVLPNPLRIVPAKPEVVSEEPLRAELHSFISAVRNRTQPVVTLAEGRRALKIALEILRQIEDHAARANLDALVPRPQ
jgi:predicted dehydrogenase